MLGRAPPAPRPALPRGGIWCRGGSGGWGEGSRVSRGPPCDPTARSGAPPTRPPLRGPVERAERPPVPAELRFWASPGAGDWDLQLPPLPTQPTRWPPRGTPCTPTPPTTPFSSSSLPLSLHPRHLLFSFSFPFPSFFSCFFLPFKMSPLYKKIMACSLSKSQKSQEKKIKPTQGNLQGVPFQTCLLRPPLGKLYFRNKSGVRLL